MYGELDKLESMKRKLDSVSPSFCMAKWMHVTLHLMTGHTHSCYLPRPHKVPLEELRENPSALHNTNYKKLQRKAMLEGKRPEECGICWSVEDLPGKQISDRHLRSIESWTIPYFDQVRNLGWDANINPTYVEVSFSSVCNFKCSYCSPHVSTRWMDEIRAQGPYVLSDGEHQSLNWVRENDLMPFEDDSNPYVEAFWKWWPDLVRTLKIFRITGGEPLLSRDTFHVLEWLNENPQPHLELQLNSNMGIPERHLDRFFALARELSNRGKIKRLMLHTSLDTWGKQAEYIRHGLDFEAYQRNIRRFLEELPKSAMAFMSTFNNLSVVGYTRFLEWVLELRSRNRRRIQLDIPHLTGPRHQAANILTEDYRTRVREIAEFMRRHQDEASGIRAIEIGKMNRILEWMGSPVDENWLQGARRDFYLFFREHDRRRGTDFLATFPEMAGFWELCAEMLPSRLEGDSKTDAIP